MWLAVLCGTGAGTNQPGLNGNSHCTAEGAKAHGANTSLAFMLGSSGIVARRGGVVVVIQVNLLVEDE